MLNSLSKCSQVSCSTAVCVVSIADLQRTYQQADGRRLPPCHCSKSAIALHLFLSHRWSRHGEHLLSKSLSRRVDILQRTVTQHRVDSYVILLPASLLCIPDGAASHCSTRCLQPLASQLLSLVYLQQHSSIVPRTQLWLSTASCVRNQHSQNNVASFVLFVITVFGSRQHRFS